MRMATVGTSLSEQYDRMWDMLRATISRFSVDHWAAGERVELMPAKWAFHIIITVDFYARDTQDGFAWDGRYKIDWEKPAQTMPSQQQLLEYLGEVQASMRARLAATADADMMANSVFPWTGKNKAAHFIYTLRHAMYHLGELSMLLRLHGAVETEWR